MAHVLLTIVLRFSKGIKASSVETGHHGRVAAESGRKGSACMSIISSDSDIERFYLENIITFQGNLDEEVTDWKHNVFLAID
ncbi:hypothetical protein N7462_004561 [Penicillium macrosclerotiorum]|uniref:uncharacterized protein n=1 Tax=Penicillium macrosclerotiorum TaxID=303699 RepID=UPI0025488327|nr:uncharacterized protein N7462_004561 [Penicillium macrosclerotiorum]KAJ5690169.1 hypothetical protein N7462_004561 [Penicillium macrosclerotiorum]